MHWIGFIASLGLLVGLGVVVVLLVLVARSGGAQKANAGKRVRTGGGASYSSDWSTYSDSHSGWGGGGDSGCSSGGGDSGSSSGGDSGGGGGCD
ncbi:hypothetical protein LZ318_16630 [Saccharopolyspora indica]|uniref:hypothetical protein n=1 Tax=Saccharopolyspora indica TaxID=1229659 RepID=UPI0022EAB0F8|nr:hypothetical protein [Saccharopolyspora indica]MDA3645792.1 hypothetical protein [Saccharopolyspora indica]